MNNLREMIKKIGLMIASVVLALGLSCNFATAKKEIINKKTTSATKSAVKKALKKGLTKSGKTASVISADKPLERDSYFYEGYYYKLVAKKYKYKQLCKSNGRYTTNGANFSNVIKCSKSKYKKYKNKKYKNKKFTGYIVEVRYIGTSDDKSRYKFERKYNINEYCETKAKAISVALKLTPVDEVHVYRVDYPSVKNGSKVIRYKK